MVVPAILHNVRNRLAIYLKVCGKVPAEVRDSDHIETATWLSSSVGCRDCRKEDENQKKSDDAGG
jgi:hypothetical protein